MSVKRCKMALPSSSQRIRKAKKSLKTMSKAKQIDLMVKARVMTRKQAERAKKKLAEQQHG